MLIRIIGACMIVCACTLMGYYLVANYKKEENALRQLVGVLDYMECELQYRMTPLPELCRLAAADNKGIICELMLNLANEMDSQISPDAGSCMNAAIAHCPKLPQRAKIHLKRLGGSMGRFDMDGQLRGFENIRQQCRKELEFMSNNRQQRLRNYQTLAICAGIALAILLI